MEQKKNWKQVDVIEDRWDIGLKMRNTSAYLQMYAVNVSQPDVNVDEIKELAKKACKLLLKQLEDDKY